IVGHTSSNFITATPVTVLVETSPPQIFAVATTNIGTTAPTINWTNTQPARTQVFYGLGAYTNSTTPDFTSTTSHSQTLTGLAPLTTYHYRVESRNAAGVVASSSAL